jgi:hypothetical protein
MSDKQKNINGLAMDYWTKIITVVNYISHSTNLEGVDDVTNDLVMTLFAYKDSNRTLFERYLKEYSS